MNRRKNPTKTRLPRSYQGRRLVKHPMIAALEKDTRSNIARRIGIGRHSVLCAEKLAELNRDYLMPATWVRAYCDVTGLPPYVFRPDIFDAAWTYPAQKADGND